MTVGCGGEAPYSNTAVAADGTRPSMPPPPPSPPPGTATATGHRPLPPPPPPLPTASGSAPACPQSAGRLRLRRAGRGPLSSGRWTVRRSVTCSVISRSSRGHLPVILWSSRGHSVVISRSFCGHRVVISRSSCCHQWAERLVKVGISEGRSDWRHTRVTVAATVASLPSRRCRRCGRVAVVAVVAWSSLSTVDSGESEVVAACVIRRPSALGDVSRGG